MFRFCVCFVLLLAGVFCSQGCRRWGQAPAESSATQEKKAVFLCAGGGNAGTTSVEQRLSALSGAEARLRVTVLDAKQSADLQETQLAQTVAAKPFAMVIEPVTQGTARGKESLHEAVKAGVIVIGLGENAARLGCTTVLLTDDKEAGRLAGQCVIQALQKKAAGIAAPEVQGRVVEIRGDETSRISLLRHEGFAEALKTVPGLILVHDAPGGWTREGGAARLRDAMRLQQSFDAVYAHDDLMALGAAKAAGALRQQLFIVGTGGLPRIDGRPDPLAAGGIDATIQTPLPAEFAWMLVRKKLEEPGFQPKGVYQMPARALDAASIKEGRGNTAPPFPAW